VKYRDALWHLTIGDCREAIFGRPRRTLGKCAGVFILTATAADLLQGFQPVEPFVVPVLTGLGCVALYFVGIFFAYLLYFTPKRMCESKQQELDQAREELTAQLEQQRVKYKSDILAEKATAQKALDERDELRRSLDPRSGGGETD